MWPHISVSGSSCYPQEIQHARKSNPYPRQVQVRQLQAQLKVDVLTALSQSSQTIYNASWSRFAAFITSHFDITPLDANSDQLELYVVHLHNLKIKSKTIRSHLSAISFKFQYAKLQSPTDSFCISKLLAGYAKSDPPPKVRHPITSDILKRIISALSRLPFTTHDRIMFTSLFSLMYHALLRICEVTPSSKHNHNLKSNQVTRQKGTPSKLSVHFKTFKFSKPGLTKLEILPAGNNTCPVSTFAQYSKIRSQKSKFAFSRQDGTDLSPSYVTRHLRSILSTIGLPPDDFNNHSFRIGRATDMARQGFTDTQICMAGRWSSSAFKKYIKPQILLFI